MKSHDQAHASLRWAKEHAAELSFVLLGIVLRVGQLRSHPPQVGYDFGVHEATVRWWTERFQMPPLLLSRGAYHPQLYYVLGGLIRRLEGGWRAVQAISIWCGCIRLGLIWLAGLRHMPNNRLARIFVLALAAVMPASVQLDGMMTQESLSNLLSVAFMVSVLEFCRVPPERRREQAMVLGFVTGLALLVKVSNFVLLGLVFVGPVLETAQGWALPLSEKLRRARAWSVAAAVAVSIGGGQYVYNHVEYGRAFLDGWYRRPTEDTQRVGAQRMEPIDRRTLGFFLGFSTDIVRFPYYPSGIEPAPRLWPVLIASSFCDYYNYSFGPSSDVGAPVQVGGKPAGERATLLGRASVAGGVVIASVSAVGWLAAVTRMLRRREVARPLVLLMPALGALGQMFFATQYPYDFEGVIKGIYFHFATLPLYAVFGVLTAWLFTRRKLRPLALVAGLSIVPVAAYTTYCALW